MPWVWTKSVNRYEFYSHCFRKELTELSGKIDKNDGELKSFKKEMDEKLQQIDNRLSQEP